MQIPVQTMKEAFILQQLQQRVEQVVAKKVAQTVHQDLQERVLLKLGVQPEVIVVDLAALQGLLLRQLVVVVEIGLELAAQLKVIMGASRAVEQAVRQRVKPVQPLKVPV